MFDRLPARVSVGLFGDGGERVGACWLVRDVLAVDGRALFDELFVVVEAAVVVLPVLVRDCVCGALMLEVRLSPVDLDCCCGCRTDELLARPDAGAVLLDACSGTAAAVPLLELPGLPEIAEDCVLACDLAEGARASWLDPGTLIDDGRDNLEGGGIACRAISPSALFSGSSFSLPRSASSLYSPDPARESCGSRLLLLSALDVCTDGSSTVKPGCRGFSACLEGVLGRSWRVPRSWTLVCFFHPVRHSAGESRVAGLEKP